MSDVVCSFCKGISTVAADWYGHGYWHCLDCNLLTKDAAALKAATPPDLVEAGKVMETLRGVTLTAFPANLAEVTDNAADTIRALIALATAQAAQIEAYRDSHLHADKQLLHEKARAEAAEAECKRRDADRAELHEKLKEVKAEAATLRAEAERLRGAVGHIESMTVHSGGEIHGVTAQHWKAAFEEAQEVARAALEGKA